MNTPEAFEEKIGGLILRLDHDSRIRDMGFRVGGYHVTRTYVAFEFDRTPTTGTPVIVPLERNAFMHAPESILVSAVVEALEIRLRDAY